MPEEQNNRQPDFVIVRTKTPEEIVGLLLERFPAFGVSVGVDDLDFAAPFLAYERFASYVRARSENRDLLSAIGKFTDELASMKDPLVGALLVTGLLESIAEDADVAQKIAITVGDQARSLLIEVEKKIYGRYDSGE
jgi:hypothetical protein